MSFSTMAGSGGAGTESRHFRPPGDGNWRRECQPSRREFLRGGLLVSGVGVVGAFGTASLAFLWPSLRGGFGARLEVGTQTFVATEIAANGHLVFPAGRAYLVAYDAGLDPEGVYRESTDGSPFMALYHRCVHLGCRVPWCPSSSWFECPCHGSRYNVWGEYQFGPAPRGLDRFRVSIESGQVIVDTSVIITGPSRATSVLAQPPAGPHCIGLMGRGRRRLAAQPGTMASRRLPATTTQCIGEAPRDRRCQQDGGQQRLAANRCGQS
jgi:cytochrome b6-f complex iron-sulfur subunit